MNFLSEICYPKNFLADVIAKVDFVSPVEELHTTLPPGVARAALIAFPIDAPKPGVAQAIKISMAKDDISSVRKKFIEWNFFGLNREKRLTISPGV